MLFSCSTIQFTFERQQTKFRNCDLFFGKQKKSESSFCSPVEIKAVVKWYQYQARAFKFIINHNHNNFFCLSGVASILRTFADRAYSFNFHTFEFILFIVLSLRPALRSLSLNKFKHIWNVCTNDILTTILSRERIKNCMPCQLVLGNDKKYLSR